MTQQIVIREIVAPRPGGKQYSLIDSGGQRWGVYADHVQDYTVGGIYNVVRAKESTFNGKIYVTLEEAEFVGMDGGQQTQYQRPTQAAPQLPRQAPPARGYSRTVQRAPTPAQRGQASSAFDDSRRMDIFVCGAINNVLSNPNVIPNELTTPMLIEMISKLSTAWRQTLGRGAAFQNSDMNDEIPEFGGGPNGP